MEKANKGQHLAEIVVARAVEIAVDQNPGKELQEDFQAIDGNGEERQQGERKQVFDDGPKARDEQAAQDETHVDGHRISQRHRHQLDFVVAVAELRIRLGLCETHVFADVPDQQPDVKVRERQNAGQRHGGQNPHRHRRLGQAHNHVVKGGDRGVGVRQHEHQVHEEADDQPPASEGSQEVQRAVFAA